MSRLSRSVPIILYNNYRNIPFSVADACKSCFPMYNADAVRCSTPIFPLIQSLFALDRGAGASMDTIIAGAINVCPNFTDDQYRETFALAIKQGIFRTIAPIQFDYFLGSTSVAKYIINPELDRKKSHSEYTKFLLSLVGGYSSPSFVRWFTLTSANCVNSTGPISTASQCNNVQS